MAGASAAAPNNLPVALTTFVGREREMEEAGRLLAEARLLTLAGAGGCGKSRLALKVAELAAGAFPDGVWVVELAGLSNPALVPQAVATTLEVLEQPGRPLGETLAGRLRSKRLLLVLDNCEHLLGACADLTEALLRSAAGVRVLATSREALRLPGETVWRVPSLAMPDLSGSLAAKDLAGYEAVRLFVERAASARPDFALTAANAAAVAQICTRLDGMPLAIELAAARVRALTPQQIAGRLGDRFRLLVGGSRKPARHRTLRAAMDWSYELLTDRERTLLARLSVFRGGWALEAAEAVCAGEGIAGADVLEILTSLVDKSLVVVDARGADARYRLLETTWEYARECLSRAPECAAAQARHRDWCLRLALAADAHLRGPGQTSWLSRLAVERDNLRAALTWSRTEPGGAAVELRLATALRWFWIVRGHWSEGRMWLEGAVSRAGGMRVPELPRALECLAYLAERQGDDEHSVAFAERCLAVSTALHDRYGVADALLRLAFTALNRQDYDRATRLVEQSLALYREVGATKDVALALSTLGTVARHRGDVSGALAAYDEALGIATRAGDQTRVAYVTWALAAVASQQGDHDRAATLHTRALILSREIEYRMIAAACLEGLADVAVSRGRLARAARLLGAAAAHREALGLRMLPADCAAHEARIASLRAAWGSGRCDRAVAAGRAMTLEQAAANALEPALPDPRVRGRGLRGAAGARATLTAREREVAELVAQGLTNRDIAGRLMVAERTAEGHVQSILNKLGFTSRAQIAAWAVARGMHTVPAE